VIVLAAAVAVEAVVVAMSVSDVTAGVGEVTYDL
jgi:hypothetical protein